MKHQFSSFGTREHRLLFDNPPERPTPAPSPDRLTGGANTERLRGATENLTKRMDGIQKQISETGLKGRLEKTAAAVRKRMEELLNKQGTEAATLNAEVDGRLARLYEAIRAAESTLTEAETVKANPIRLREDGTDGGWKRYKFELPVESMRGTGPTFSFNGKEGTRAVSSVAAPAFLANQGAQSPSSGPQMFRVTRAIEGGKCVYTLTVNPALRNSTNASRDGGIVIGTSSGMFRTDALPRAAAVTPIQESLKTSVAAELKQEAAKKGAAAPRTVPRTEPRAPDRAPEGAPEAQFTALMDQLKADPRFASLTLVTSTPGLRAVFRNPTTRQTVTFSRQPESGTARPALIRAYHFDGTRTQPPVEIARANWTLAGLATELQKISGPAAPVVQPSRPERVETSPDVTAFNAAIDGLKTDTRFAALTSTVREAGRVVEFTNAAGDKITFTRNAGFTGGTNRVPASIGVTLYTASDRRTATLPSIARANWTKDGMAPALLRLTAPAAPQPEVKKTVSEERATVERVSKSILSRVPGVQVSIDGFNIAHLSKPGRPQPSVSVGYSAADRTFTVYLNTVSGPNVVTRAVARGVTETNLLKTVQDQVSANVTNTAPVRPSPETNPETQRPWERFNKLFADARGRYPALRFNNTNENYQYDVALPGTKQMVRFYRSADAVGGSVSIGDHMKIQYINGGTAGVSTRVEISDWNNALINTHLNRLAAGARTPILADVPRTTSVEHGTTIVGKNLLAAAGLRQEGDKLYSGRRTESFWTLEQGDRLDFSVQPGGDIRLQAYDARAHENIVYTFGPNGYPTQVSRTPATGPRPEVRPRPEPRPNPETGSTDPEKRFQDVIRTLRTGPYASYNFATSQGSFFPAGSTRGVARDLTVTHPTNGKSVVFSYVRINGPQGGQMTTATFKAPGRDDEYAGNVDSFDASAMRAKLVQGFAESRPAPTGGTLDALNKLDIRPSFGPGAQELFRTLNITVDGDRLKDGLGQVMCRLDRGDRMQVTRMASGDLRIDAAGNGNAMMFIVYGEDVRSGGTVTRRRGQATRPGLVGNTERRALNNPDALTRSLIGGPADLTSRFEFFSINGVLTVNGRRPLPDDERAPKILASRGPVGERNPEGGWDLRLDSGSFASFEWEGGKTLTDMVRGNKAATEWLAKNRADMSSPRPTGWDAGAQRSVLKWTDNTGKTGYFIFSKPSADGMQVLSICDGGVESFPINAPEGSRSTIRVHKPVVYVYPTKETDVNVDVRLNGMDFVAQYPKMPAGGWNVRAKPDGSLTDKATGKPYSYLFWEADGATWSFDDSTAHCVASSDAESFLEESLTTLGLNAKERNDFIVYWLPKMERNPYNLVHFVTKEYEDRAELAVTPKPDSVIRVFMVFKSAGAKAETKPAALKSAKRSGFAVVEWGGSDLDEGNKAS